VLDGYGGLHPYGGARPAVGGGYWSGWDIAARVVVAGDGTGLVMDGYGGLHPFAGAGTSVPSAPTGGPYWSGWRIARDLVLLPGSPAKGYVLDGYGGLHAFGGAPAAHTTGYWSGWDIARRVALDPSGTGGYVLDGYGGLHPFSVGGASLPPAASGNGYWSGWDIARALVLTGTARGWTIDGYGGAHPFGGASGAGSWSWSGHDLIVDGNTGGSGIVVYGDRYGGIHTAPESAPAIDGSAYWPAWDIARDLAALPG
jgi:hypothetical protein